MGKLSFKKKKIVYLIGNLVVGGAEWQTLYTATRVNQDIFDSKICCLFGGGPLKAYLDQRHVEITILREDSQNSSRLWSKPIQRFKSLLSLYRYLRQEQPEIVHCFMYAPSVYGGIAAKLARIPVLLTNRVNLGLFKDANPWYQLAENFVNRFTDCVIVNSEAVKAGVLHRETIPPERIRLVYNGVDIRTYQPFPANSCERLRLKKRELGIPETAPVIGILANLIPYKGHHDFLVAAANVRQRYPDAYFVCIGEDRGIQPELEHLCDTLGLRDHVIFTGVVLNVSEILPIFDIQVSASHEEGFAHVILEGMACGKPIVATAVGGTPEAIRDKVTGLLVPPKNPEALATAILALLDQPEWAAQLGQHARQHVETHFSVDHMITTLERLYLDLLKKRGRV